MPLYSIVNKEARMSLLKCNLIIKKLYSKASNGSPFYPSPKSLLSPTESCIIWPWASLQYFLLSFPSCSFFQLLCPLCHCWSWECSCSASLCFVFPVPEKMFPQIHYLAPSLTSFGFLLKYWLIHHFNLLNINVWSIFNINLSNKYQYLRQ